MYLLQIFFGFLLGYFFSNINYKDLARNIFDFSLIPSKVYFFLLQFFVEKIIFILLEQIFVFHFFDNFNIYRSDFITFKENSKK